MKSISQNEQPVNYQFSPHGYPINPATGQMFSRAEIVADPSIPLPTFVDATNPPPYWQRRTGDELAAETKRIADKQRRNKQARDRRQAQRNGGRMVTMATVIAAPTLALVERVNAPKKVLNDWGRATGDPEAETDEPLTAAEWDEGPQTFAESIQELLGQDYKAERVRSANPAKMKLPTAEESQRMLELALNPGRANIAAPQRWQFGRR